ncbi:MAG: insulinase family protein [Gemmatimonadota bacterium]|nr:MAG: insulinase family protein [Gemmatimonadota bacterium]
MSAARSVSLGIWVEHGGAHDADSEQGLAHLLEHMVFKGTRRRSAHQIALEVERVGGSLDAYTSHDHTGYLARVPMAYAELAIDVLADLVFDPALRAEDLELERPVILEEIAALEDSPEQLVFELQGRQLYGDHPYGRSILGAAHTVAEVEVGALGALHSCAYVPGNCVVAAAGRLDGDRLLEMLQRHLPDPGIPRREEVPPLDGRLGGVEVVERPGGRQSHLLAGALSIPHSHPLRYALILVETALGAGMSSRLFQRIREELGLAYSVYTFHSFYRSAGHVGAYVGTRPETSGQACDALLAEFRDVAENGLTAVEIESTKRQLRGQLLLGLESTASRMQRLAGVMLYRERYMTVDELAERIESITVDEIHEAAAFFHPDRVAVLELRPA